MALSTVPETPLSPFTWVGPSAMTSWSETLRLAFSARALKALPSTWNSENAAPLRLMRSGVPIAARADSADIA